MNAYHPWLSLDVFQIRVDNISFSQRARCSSMRHGSLVGEVAAVVVHSYPLPARLGVPTTQCGRPVHGRVVAEPIVEFVREGHLRRAHGAPAASRGPSAPPPPPRRSTQTSRLGGLDVIDYGILAQ